MTRRRRFSRFGWVAVLLLVSGCAGRYFQDAGPPPAPALTPALEDFSPLEYWTGIVFNGEKIGYSHFRLAPSASDPGRFEIRSEALLRFRFLTVDKRVHLTGLDRVNPDLSLLDFQYRYLLDGNRLEVEGAVEGGALAVKVVARGRAEEKRIPLEGPVYPTGAIHLLAPLRGMEKGRAFRFPVFDGESQGLDTAEQRVEAYERSELFSGPAFKVKTRWKGQEAVAWIDEKARPLLEMSLGGVLIAALEPKLAAEQYLAQAALNKSDLLLEFSRIPADIPLRPSERITALEVRLSGFPEGFQVPSGGRQSCRAEGEGFRCRVEEKGLEPASGGGERHLQPSFAAPAHHPEIVRLASSIAAGKEGALSRIEGILGWMAGHIRKEAVDGFTALDVLAEGKGECQGHAFLFAALARALGVPTRVVNGIVYVADFGGFLYHTWNESLVEGRWLAVDPTFGQMPADASHIKLIEGEQAGELTPLLGLVGRLSLQVAGVEAE